MKFYTNITRWGNHLLLREYVNGQRLNRRIKYSPTMYSIVTKPTEYRTLEGKFVTPIKHQTMQECNEWVDNYKNQPELIYYLLLRLCQEHLPMLFPAHLLPRPVLYHHNLT